MKLIEGLKNTVYTVSGMDLPLKTERRLETLGMVHGARITLLNKKNSALVVAVRGARFALGREVAKHIEVKIS